ncbi:MAG: Ig-like domain-containing protein [Dysgonamonadaceae bacterium]|nr:Ig-like domain-containing protein [Dysgonamonadaceae bacterium]
MNKSSSYKTMAGALCLAACMMLSSCEKEQQPVALETFQFAGSDTPIDALDVGEVQPVTVTLSPENTTERIIWTSADPEIAQVQSNEPGRVAGVIGLKVGNTLVSASTLDGRFSQSFPVEVIIKVKKITFSDGMILQSPGTGRFDVLFDPENATIRDLLWTSGNPEVVGIDPASGLITALSPGSSVITATAKQGGKSASIEIFVSGEPPVFGQEYCSITGYGDYCADRVSTSGAVQDLAHSNANIPTDNYRYYEGEKLTVKRGEPFTLNLVQSNNWSRTLIWIDWNGDKDFADEGELVAVFGNFEELNDSPFSRLIAVPEDASPGFARMRVITGDSWSFNFDLESVEPCGNVRHGTVKDFEVEIIN